MNDTPRTNDFAHKLRPFSWQLGFERMHDFARTLERENAQLRAALELIAQSGGFHIEHPEPLSMNGSWCAEQARTALNQSTP